MIDNLINFSIRNKIIIGLFTFALVIWGVYSVTKLPIDAVPDITNNQVQVITSAPTLAAQEVERFITYPIEVSMATIPGIVEIRSISRFGLSVVTVVFKDEVSVLDARQHVSEKLKTAQNEIPQGLGSPEMAPITTGLGEIYQYILHTKPSFEKKYSAMDLRTMQDWIVRRQLLGTDGVADVSSFGGYVKQYEISISPEKLRAMNVSISEIMTALERNNQNTGGAYIDKKPNAYFIRGIGLVSGIEDIQKIVVKNTEGVPLLIRDVAEVQYGHAVRYGAMTRNDEGEVVGALVLMLKGENSNQVIQNVKQRMATIQKSLPEGVVIEPFLDRSDLVGRAIYTVSKNLIEGGLIVVFVLVLLLGNLRAGLIVASVIPLAMLFAICMMNIFNVSGNLMSLGAIDFGLIVDGAVIIVEAIVHRISGGNRFPGIAKLNREQMDQEVFEASVKIRKTAAFGEIIILIVYLPILALVGIEGKMFGPMAQTVAFAIMGALILSLTYVPMMSALFLSRKTEHKRNISDKIMDFFHRIYNPIIHQALKKKLLVVGIAVGLFIVSLILFLNMGGEFIPTLEEGDFAIETRVPPGSSLSQTIETSLKAGEILMKKFPEVKQVVSRIGASEIPTDPMPIEAADLIVILKDKEEWTSADNREELAEKMNKELSILPGVSFGFQQPIQLRFNELMTGARQDIAIKIFGEDLNVLAVKAQEVSEIIKGTEGVGDMFVEQVTGLPQIIVEYNRDKIAQYGLNVEDLNTVVSTAFAGESAGLVFEGEKRFELVVRLKEQYRQNIEDVRSLYVSLPNGNQIPITEVASIEFKQGAMQVSREDAKRRITVGVNVRERDVESLVEEIQQKLDAKLKLDPGYYVTYGGQFENLVEAKARLSVAVPVALALIMLLLFFTFGSFKYALLIFSAIPMSAIGGVFALLIRGMPFSISAGVGFIALFGVAVLNGIVLIGYFNQLKNEGMTDIKERILKGTHVRLRPVIMTAAVASLGFLPMALSNSSGAEVQKPLATVVIGGLITATLLTLIVLPVLYSYFERIGKSNSSSTGTVASIIAGLMIIGLPLSSKAQVTATSLSQPLTLEAAINTAIQNSPGIQSVSYEVEQQRTLKKTGIDLSKTNVGITYGQYNGPSNDNALNISQTFAFPTAYARSINLSREQIISSEYRLAVSKNELKRNVKLVYYQLVFNLERQKLLLYQDSLYSDFKRSADLRFETGEANYLEKIAAETRVMEIRNALFQTESDIRTYKTQLQKLLNVPDSVSIAETSPYYKLNVPTDTSLLNQNPYLAYLKQQMEISKAQTKLERSRLMPDLTVGFTSQTLQGIYNVNGTDQYFGKGNRFEYVQAGVGIPLWFVPQRARIQSAKIGEQIAASNFQYQKIQLESELQSFVQQYLKYQNSIQYYEQKALPQANLIIDFAGRGFSQGESGYVEYIQNITQALQIKLDYLETLNQSNQTSTLR